MGDQSYLKVLAYRSADDDLHPGESQRVALKAERTDTGVDLVVYGTVELERFNFDAGAAAYLAASLASEAGVRFGG